MKDEPQFLTGEAGLKAYGKQTIDNIEDRIVPPKGKAIAYSPRTFVGHDTNISVKSEYLRSDYEYFRPGRTLPTTQIESIAMCMDCYNKMGIVRDIVDLMAEFASYGIKLQHPRKSTENFYVKWFNDIVRGPELSCRFLIMLLKAGNVIIRRSTGKIPTSDETEWKKAINQDLVLEKLGVTSREIPVRYTFINPCAVELIGGELSTFIGKPILDLIAPGSLRGAISGKIGQDPRVKKLVDSIPKDLLSQLSKNAARIPLDMDKIEIFYYKKDDWLPWAYPITASALSDLMMLEQMKLADISALDGAISNIRLWNIGILDGANSILPNKGVINKLRNILANNVGGGVLDLVWGPELKFTESSSQVWQFLGPEKYESTLNAIYAAFGIPSSLRASVGTNNTGNYVALNTFVKRLQYIRDVLVSFWKKEIAIVHKAMNFKGSPPRIIFNNMSLADEAAEKQLLINLWDRDIISTESVREIFGRIPEVEQSRVKVEMTDRESEEMPEKASPYHNPEKEHDYKKLFAQAGDITPTEVGMKLNPRKEGEKSRTETMRDTQIELKKIAPPGGSRVGSAGRPKSVTETKKRKAKPTSRPSTKAALLDIAFWAKEAQDEIAEMVYSTILAVFNKANARKLTNEEAFLAEELKFNILCAIEPFSKIDNEMVYSILSAGAKPNLEISRIAAKLKASQQSPLNIKKLRRLYTDAYSLYYVEKN